MHIEAGIWTRYQLDMAFPHLRAKGRRTIVPFYKIILSAIKNKDLYNKAKHIYFNRHNHMLPIKDITNQMHIKAGVGTPKIDCVWVCLPDLATEDRRNYRFLPQHIFKCH